MDSRKCQTFTATPAKPGVFLFFDNASDTTVPAVHQGSTCDYRPPSTRQSWRADIAAGFIERLGQAARGNIQPMRSMPTAAIQLPTTLSAIRL